MKETCRTGHKERDQDNRSLLDKADRVGEGGQGRKSRSSRGGFRQVKFGQDRIRKDKVRQVRQGKAEHSLDRTGSASLVKVSDSRGH